MSSEVLLLAISLSLDALCVGVLYGIRRVRIPFPSKLILCFLAAGFSGLSLLAGHSLAAIVPERIANWVGASFLAAIGVWIAAQAFRKRDEEKTGSKPKKACRKDYQWRFPYLGLTIHIIRDPLAVDADASGHIDWREALVLGAALSVDAIGAGVGSGLMGIGTWALPAAVAIFQMIFLSVGYGAGRRFHSLWRFGERAVSLLSGACMLALALIRVL